jgi:hypothetical protein
VCRWILKPTFDKNEKGDGIEGACYKVA